MLAVMSVPVFLIGLNAKQAQSAPMNYSQNPKVANLFFRWDITEKEAKDLAQWDILIVDMEVQTYSPQSLKLIKKYNPDIKILAYLAAQEIRGDSGSLHGTLRRKLYVQIDNQWWLRDVNRNKVYWWPTNPIINITSKSPTQTGNKFYDIFPWFLKNEIMSSGLWDGIFFDNTWENIDFLSKFNIDLDQDGRAESQSELNSYWQQGMVTILNNTRNVLGSQALIVTNGGEGYYKYINGTMYEHFPYKGWADTLNQYRFISQNGQHPAIGILNTNVNNTGNRTDYQKMRYGLTSALLGDGFYSFDNGDMSHHEIWWYDEYEAFLGAPISEPVDVLTGQKNIHQSVWRREFENGIVLVNSTAKNYSIDLFGEFEKLHGTQDTYTNNGAIVNKVDLAPHDGIILLKTVSNENQIFDATFVNGSYARFFDAWGQVKKTGFFVYLSRFKGGAKIMIKDLDNNGSQETLVADEAKIEIYNSAGQKIKTFYPYGASFNRGINFAVGDLDNNGTLEIVTGTENGGGPHVRIFNYQGDLINPGFFAYASNFRGGVNVAVGDLDGNGTQEIVCGAGVGGGPHIRVFNKDGKLINPGFFAYDPKFRGGVNVAVADLDKDGKQEIISGPGNGGGPHIRIFNQQGQMMFAQFFAFDKSISSGAEVLASDIDKDGTIEVVATSNDVFSFFNY